MAIKIRKIININLITLCCLIILCGSSTIEASTRYKIDQAHSRIGFSVKHLGISRVYGIFEDYSGEILWDKTTKKVTSIKAKIKTNSIQTHNKKRDDHLRSVDFFDCETYPIILFKGKTITKAKNGYTVKGILHLHGVTQLITLPFQVLGPIDGPYGKKRLALSGEFELDRNYFKISYNKKLERGISLIGDKVLVQIDIEAVENISTTSQ